MTLALKRPVMVLAPVALLVVALALFTNVLPFREIVSQRQEIAAKRAYLTELEEANRALENQVEALQTPLEIERIARERLGYVRPGEEAYVVIDPGESGDTRPVPPPTEPAPAEPSLWDRIWAFLTGSDLVRPG